MTLISFQTVTHAAILCFYASFVYLLSTSAKTEAVPVIIDVSQFNDPWEYRIEPQKSPLLNATNGKHELPPEPEVTLAKKYGTEIPKTSFIRAAKKLANSVRSYVSCPACKIGVGLMQKELKRGKTSSDIKIKFVGLCVGLKIQAPVVCNGIFDVYSSDLLPALKATSLGPAEICGLILGENCPGVDVPDHEWEVILPDTPKPELKTKQLQFQSGGPTFKVLHLSDTHYDPLYEVGSPSNCEEPLCCRSTSTPPSKGNVIPAGRWGSYSKCDTPRELFVNMLENIAKAHQDIDYIIWTGDIPPHDIWNQTREDNLDNLRYTIQEIFEHFPGIPIFPALGNHESVPAGSFAPPWVKDDEHSIDWLYEEVAAQWSKWLPADSNKTILHGGFYSVLLRPGFRLISLNTNYCHYISWWLLVSSIDPAAELRWLVHELQTAENNGEKVHIIGHIPPGSTDCMKVWSRNYYEIVDRFEDTIAAQFFGHTHADEFEMFYDSQEFKRPTSVAYLGPSLTTFENFNPGYRIYYVEGEYKNSTRKVIDFETWILNLDVANKAKEEVEPQWFKLYSAREGFGLKSLDPEEWDNLIESMIDNEELFAKFHRFYYRDSPTRPQCKEALCKLQILCDLKSGRSHDRHHLCNYLELAFGT